MNELPRLSARETQLLDLAGKGFTDTAISHKLGISETTVKTYWARLRTKLGPFSRTELVAKVIRQHVKSAIEVLEEENRRFRQFIEVAGDAILIVSTDGAIEMLNESAAELFGWPKEELQGQHISILLPHRYQRIHAMHVQHYVQAPSKRNMGDHLVTPAAHRSGAEIRISASLSMVASGNSSSVICIIRSVGQKK